MSTYREHMPPLSYLTLLDIVLLVNLSLVALAAFSSSFAPQLARILFPIVYIAWTVAVFVGILWINSDNHKLVDPKECSFGGVPLAPLSWH